jgi:uncharacterized protein YdhG (YjbR/CyaY superfamily)
MSFQAYLDNIKAKTGKTPEDFKKIAEKKGLLKPGVKAGQIVSWLKEDFSLGHGHAMAIYAVFSGAKSPEPKAEAKDIDTYIALQPESMRATLEELRQIIKSVAPEAEETISYAMPAFKYHGMLVGFAAAKKHYGFYPWTGRTVAQFADDLKGYDTTKGAIHLQIDKPLPVALIKKIVKHRMKENMEMEKKTVKKTSKK